MRFGLSLVALLLVCSSCLAVPAPDPEFGGHHGDHEEGHEGHDDHHHEEGHHGDDGNAGESR